MMDDPGPLLNVHANTLLRELQPGDFSTILLLGALLILCLAITGICAAAENAFYSHRESDLEELRDKNTAGGRNILYLLAYPKHLLATILILNSLGMVAFVVVSTLFNETLFNLEHQPWLRFFIDAIVVTLIILIFGELMPKVYATLNYRKSGIFLSFPMRFFVFVLWPFSNLMVKMTGFLEKKVRQKLPELTPEELSHAIDITADKEDAQQEKEILKGIVNIGQIQVKQIMKPRLDMAAIEEQTPFQDVLNYVREMRFSRIPIYKDNLDQIVGILNIKKLLPHLDEAPGFEWHALLTAPMFVPENKMIDDLLHEFRVNRNHQAIVVDEFGGTSGIVTLEDILEEVFGELNDEFDEETQQYSRLDENTYLFEGKCLLIDFLRICHLPIGYFDDIETESDTLGGLVCEIAGRIPEKGEELNYRNIVFTIDAAELRKVNRIKVKLNA
jgi:gliding motility-associated protein GldE